MIAGTKSITIVQYLFYSFINGDNWTWNDFQKTDSKLQLSPTKIRHLQKGEYISWEIDVYEQSKLTDCDSGINLVIIATE